MLADNKYFETGSNPFHLNLNNTAKDFSFTEMTNPQFGLLDTLSKFIIIDNNVTIQEPHLNKGVFIEPPLK